MDALIARIHQIIRWPTPQEIQNFAEDFDYVGRSESKIAVTCSCNKF